MLHEAGKEIVKFSGIMSNPTYEEGAVLAREYHADFILAVGGSVINCCKVVSAQAMRMKIFGIWSTEKGNFPRRGFRLVRL